MALIYANLAGAFGATIAERLVRRAAIGISLAIIRADDAAEQKENDAFRQTLAIGTETNCGTVIQIRRPMVEIAVLPVRLTPNGQSTFWSKRTVLARSGIAPCTYGL